MIQTSSALVLHDHDITKPQTDEAFSGPSGSSFLSFIKFRRSNAHIWIRRFERVSGICVRFE